MEFDFRCTCPITSALDLVGDRWTLVIIKQMLLEEAETFKDFLEGEEGIATNILSARLKMLEESRLLTKHKRPDNKKTNIYRLTEKGLALTPMVVELALWTDEHLREFHPTARREEALEQMHRDKNAFIKVLLDRYRSKDPVV